MKLFLVIFIFINFPLFSVEQNLHSLAFIENKGQIIDQNNKPNPNVLYLLNTPGLNIQLRKGGFSYDVYSRPTQHSRLNTHDSTKVKYHRIDFDFLNFNTNYTLETSEPIPGYINQTLKSWKKQF